MPGTRVHDGAFGAFVIFKTDVGAFDKQEVQGSEEGSLRAANVFVDVKDGVDARVFGVRRHSVSDVRASPHLEDGLVGFEKLALFDDVQVSVLRHRGTERAAKHGFDLQTLGVGVFK